MKRTRVLLALAMCIMLLAPSCMTSDKIKTEISAQVSQMQSNILVLVDDTAKALVKQELDASVAAILQRMDAIEAHYAEIITTNSTFKTEISTTTDAFKAEISTLLTEAKQQLAKIASDYEKIINVFVTIASERMVPVN